MRVCSGILGWWKQLRLHWLFGSFKKKKKWFTEITGRPPSGPPLIDPAALWTKISGCLSSLPSGHPPHLPQDRRWPHPPTHPQPLRPGGVYRVSGLKPAGWNSPGSQDADCLRTACLLCPPSPPCPHCCLCPCTHTHTSQDCTLHFTLTATLMLLLPVYYLYVGYCSVFLNLVLFIIL